MAGPTPIVELRGVVKRFGHVTAVAGVSFEVSPGQCVSLLGPSGCGKTTTLRMIAGFEAPDQGDILIAGQDMRGRRPYERNIGLVFQDYALFPHMTVEQNIAYGMRHRGVERRAIPGRTRDALARVKLSGYEARRPSQLSGGEQQRVALARALVTEPAVMLLDEPLSNLDAKLRQELRVELKEILTAVGTTTIIVTHDQEEAMSLADHVILMNRGRVVQRGHPPDLYAHPRNKFVAEFIGRSNWFSGRFEREVGRGVWEYRTAEGLSLLVPRPEGRDGGPFEVGVRPERIAIDRDGSGRAPSGSGGPAGEDRPNVLQGTVDFVENLGADVHIWIRLPGGQRIRTVEKNADQVVEAPGSPIRARFGLRDCIVVGPEAEG
jgi:ABC-type Fe3+/spermidine/putrescine transport system ATPase subunit